MAVFNQCAHLFNADALENIKSIKEGSSESGLQFMLNMQSSLQGELQKRLSTNGVFSIDENSTIGNLVDFFRFNKEAIDNEFFELLTACGGMSNGEKNASAVWKQWKANYIASRSKNVNDMSQEDKLELQFEMIDIFHFVLNMFNALGLSGEDILDMYILKNLENLRRYQNGY